MGRNKTIDDDELLRHARAAFREGGHAASTREIAKAAGISQAVLFQRFGSKEDLFLRAMTPELPDVETLLGPYPRQSAKKHLESVAERLVDFFAGLTPTLLQVLAHPDLEPDRLAKWHAGLPFEPLLQGLTERFERMRNDGLVGKIDSNAAALAFLVAVHSVVLIEAMPGAAGRKRRPGVRSLIATLWQGLAP